MTTPTVAQAIANQDPGAVLKAARVAVEAKDHETALTGYHWFYDNALAINRSFAGVRLSYCLSEWERLGRVYTPARMALLALKERTLASFRHTPSKRFFNDYQSLCEALATPEEALAEFHRIEDPALATQFFPAIYRYCAARALWDLCYQYIGDGAREYRQSLYIFDSLLESAEELANEGIKNDSIRGFQEEVGWILAMLRHVQADQAHARTLAQLKTDMERRDFAWVYQEVAANHRL